MAAYFKQKGYEVSLYAREKERVDMFLTNDFHLTGAMQSTVTIDLISTDMAEVIKDAYLIMVTTPSQYHHVVAKEMASCVLPEQIVVLNPGRTFGTYEYAQVLRDNGCADIPVLAEVETFIFTCRCEQPGYPILFGIKSDALVAAHDPDKTPAVVDCLQKVFDSCEILGRTVLETGLQNIGMVFHPIPVLMNLTRIEKKERFLYYKEAISPLVAGILEKLDAERVAVAKALGVPIMSASDWMRDRYGCHGNNLYELIQDNVAYNDVYAPTSIYTRYIFEDVATGCVPVSCIGKKIGVPTPIIDSVIHWASSVYSFDFYKEGRNSERIGLDNIELHI